MTKSQILITVFGILAVILLFSLPKVVVKDEESTINSSEEEVHTTEATSDPEFQKSIDSLKDSLRIGSDTKKSAIFADSLAERYRSLNRFDSVAYLYEGILEENPEVSVKKKAADAYFEAYTYSVEDERRLELAGRAKVYYQEILESDPDDLESKTNLGMLIVGTENPMQGVGLLREVLEADPTNYQALYNMGVLSLQSNQIGRAVERFEELVENYPDSMEGRFYLALSYMQSGKNAEAKEQFEIVKRSDPDPAVQATVDSYLKEIE